jgi:hypothetical protein
MKGMLAVAVATLMMLALLPGRSGAFPILLPRAGQVGVGLQGQYGTLFKSGQLGQEFGHGGGISVRLKYRMRYERGIGLSYESQHMTARRPRFDETAFIANADSVTRSKLSIATAGFDLYQFFGTRTRTPRYLNASLGVAAPISAKLSDGETQYPLGGDGFYLAAGGGVEWFVYRSWAVDVSSRYMAVMMDGKVDHDVHVSLGMTFYAAY